MVSLVIMPKLGFNMSEGKLIRWYKKEGEAIQKGEPLFAIETDKTTIDIEATADGFVRKILLQEGDHLAVTLPIAVIAGREDDITTVLAEAQLQLGNVLPASDPQNQAAPHVPPVMPHAPSRPMSAEPRSGRVMASPRARRKAEELGIDLGQVGISGTGFENGVCERDVTAYYKERPAIRASALARKVASSAGVELSGIVGTGAGGKIMRADIDLQLAGRIVDTDTRQPSAAVMSAGKEIEEIVPYAGVRRIIGERLSESMQAAPHVYFTRKVDMQNLLELRRQVNEFLPHKTSVTDFIAKAVALALQKYGDLNASLVGNEIEKYRSVNLGIAVAAPSGLIVPVVRNSQNLSIPEIAQVTAGLIEKARAGKLAPDDYSGGTFTLSNLGMFGIDQFTAVINPPESGILAVGATHDEVVAIRGRDGLSEMAVRPMVNLTLSVDHRVVDGMMAAQFVAELKELMENPIRLLAL